MQTLTRQPLEAVQTVIERETAAVMLYHAGIDFTDFGERYGDRETYQAEQLTAFIG